MIFVSAGCNGLFQKQKLLPWAVLVSLVSTRCLYFCLGYDLNERLAKV
jgi:hypothetical protein